jgi:hypothetical protein
MNLEEYERESMEWTFGSRESMQSNTSEESTSSRSAGGRYQSRFKEHMSQIFTAPPDFSDFTPRPPPAMEKKKKLAKERKHSLSVDSFVSSDSTASSSSLRLIKELFAGTKRVKSETRGTLREGEFVVGNRKLTKGDIKIAGLTGSSNLWHHI